MTMIITPIIQTRMYCTDDTLEHMHREYTNLQLLLLLVFWHRRLHLDVDPGDT
jgi:hypothetical protein